MKYIQCSVANTFSGGESVWIAIAIVAEVAAIHNIIVLCSSRIEIESGIDEAHWGQAPLGPIRVHQRDHPREDRSAATRSEVCPKPSVPVEADFISRECYVRVRPSSDIVPSGTASHPIAQILFYGIVLPTGSRIEV